MFTTKHIHIVGDETLLQVESVRYTPPVDMTGCASSGQLLQSSTPATVWVVEKGDCVETPLTGGTIFVMNEAGKTVARYDLGASPVPIFGDGLTDARLRGVGVSAGIGGTRVA